MTEVKQQYLDEAHPIFEYKGISPNGAPKLDNGKIIKMTEAPKGTNAILSDQNGIEMYYNMDTGELYNRYEDDTKPDINGPYYITDIGGFVHYYQSIDDNNPRFIKQIDNIDLCMIFPSTKPPVTHNRGTPKIMKGTPVNKTIPDNTLSSNIIRQDELKQERFEYIRPRYNSEYVTFREDKYGPFPFPDNFIGIVRDINGVEAYMRKIPEGQDGQVIIKRYNCDTHFDNSKSYYLTRPDGNYYFVDPINHNCDYIGTLTPEDTNLIFNNSHNDISLQQVNASVKKQLESSKSTRSKQTSKKTAPKKTQGRSSLGKKEKEKVNIYIPEITKVEITAELHDLIIKCVEDGGENAHAIPLFIHVLKDDFKVVDSVNTNRIYFWNDDKKIWHTCNDKTMIYYIHNKLPHIVNSIYYDKLNEHAFLSELLEDDTEDDEDDDDETKTQKKALRRLGFLVKGLGFFKRDIATKKYVKDTIDSMISKLLDTEFEELLDATPNLLSVANGVVDLKTGDLRDRKRDDYLTYALKTRYNKDADRSATIKMVGDLMLDIQSLIDNLQLILGYCITGEQSLKSFYIFHGPEGNNAKSTFLLILGVLLGKMYKDIPPTTLAAFNQKNANPSGHSAHLMCLKNKRLVTASEFPPNFKLNNRLIKSFTGSDLQTGRVPHASEETSFFPTCKFILNCNDIPSLEDLDEKAIARTNLVPFECIFNNNPDKDDTKQKKADRFFREKFTSDKTAMEGLLAWLVDGAIIFYSGDHPAISEIIKKKNEENAEKQNPYLQFKIAKLIEPKDPFLNPIPREWRFRATPLYQTYCDWCKFEARIDFVDITKFGKYMKSLLRSGGDNVSNYYVCKIRVIDEDETDNDPPPQNTQNISG